MRAPMISRSFAKISRNTRAAGIKMVASRFAFKVIASNGMPEISTMIPANPAIPMLAA